MAEEPMTFIKNTGKQILDQTIGQGMSLLFGKAQDNRQYNQQKRLWEEEMKNNKEMGKFNQDLSYDMWLKTNYPAQVEQMKKAGLSISGMYEGGGTSGIATGGTASGVEGTSAGDPNSAMNIGAQMAMQKAQLDNINANTEKTRTETEKIGGVDTEKTTAETGNLKVDKQFKELNLRIGNATENDAIAQIKDTADKALWDAENAQTNKLINENTYKEQIENIKNQAIGSAIYNKALQQGIKLDQAKAIEIANSISQKWEELKVTREGQQISKENMAKLTEAMLWQAGINATGNIIGDIIDIKKMGSGQKHQMKMQEKQHKHEQSKSQSRNKY